MKTNSVEEPAPGADKTKPTAAAAPKVTVAPLRFRIKRILIPIDFSEPCKKALRYARPFAEQFDARLTLIHVHEPIVYPSDFGYVPLDPQEFEQQRVDDLERKLRALADELGATVPVEATVRHGRAWKEVVDAAATMDTDLIIVATHGYTGFQHALLGSVAEKIVRHAPCPVLVVRSEEHDFV
jgi:nucleotide-binding universal stress UspA family protein